MDAKLFAAAVLLCAVAPRFTSSMNVTESAPEASCPYVLPVEWPAGPLRLTRLLPVQRFE